MFQWTEKSAAVLQQGGVVAPDERLPWPQTAAMGVQHVIAMFGATVLAPILMGFDPNVCVGLVAVFTRGMVQRLLILVGLILASIVYALLTNGMGLGRPMDFSGIANAAWLGAPSFAAPVFSGPAIALIVPVAIILVAE